MDSEDKITKVSCAIIENNGEILAAKRSIKMSMPLKWEFPGGKVESGESPEQCIIREIKEEINVDIKVIHGLPSYIHDYNTKKIELIPFICIITGGIMKCLEHEIIIFDTPERLKKLDWAAADVPILSQYMDYINMD